MGVNHLFAAPSSLLELEPGGLHNERQLTIGNRRILTIGNRRILAGAMRFRVVLTTLLLGDDEKQPPAPAAACPSYEHQDL